MYRYSMTLTLGSLIWAVRRMAGCCEDLDPGIWECVGGVRTQVLGHVIVTGTVKVKLLEEPETSLSCHYSIAAGGSPFSFF